MPEWASEFLASLTLTPNVSEACRQAGITRKAAYDLRKANPEFAEAWNDALEESTDELVGEAYRRAREGTERPVYFKGKECGRFREYSDTLMIFLLKAHRRGTYGDKLQADLTTGGQPIQIYMPANGREVTPGPDDPAQLDAPGDLPQLPG
jgi:hypothetical protein